MQNTNVCFKYAFFDCLSCFQNFQQVLNAHFRERITCISSYFSVLISPYLYKGLPLPVIPQTEILSSVAYNPITVWTTSNLPLSPLPSDLSPISGYPSSLSDTSSKDHSGSESPRSDEDERMLTKFSDPHGVDSEKFQCSLCSKSYSTYSGLLKHKQLQIGRAHV